MFPLFVGVFLVCWCFPCLERVFLVCWCFSLFGGVFLVWKGFSLFGKGFLVWKGFPLFGKGFLVWKGFSLFGKVFPCLEVSHHANPKSPSKFPRKPKTLRYFVPRGTLIQSRISRSLFLIALYTCLIQCIDNKANKITMIKGRASPVAITYRPNSNAMYPQNKMSTKYINIPIKNIQ